jgi:hypothetical protein
MHKVLALSTFAGFKNSAPDTETAQPAKKINFLYNENNMIDNIQSYDYFIFEEYSQLGYAEFLPILLALRMMKKKVVFVGDAAQQLSFAEVLVKMEESDAKQLAVMQYNLNLQFVSTYLDGLGEKMVLFVDHRI